MAKDRNDDEEQASLAQKAGLMELRAREIEARARRIEAEIRLIRASAELDELRKGLRAGQASAAGSGSV